MWSKQSNNKQIMTVYVSKGTSLGVEGRKGNHFFFISASDRLFMTPATWKTPWLLSHAVFVSAIFKLHSHPPLTDTRIIFPMSGGEFISNRYCFTKQSGFMVWWLFRNTRTLVKILVWILRHVIILCFLISTYRIVQLLWREEKRFIN